METCYDMDKPQKHYKIVKETRQKRLCVRFLKKGKSLRGRKQRLPEIRGANRDLTANG